MDIEQTVNSTLQKCLEMLEYFDAPLQSNQIEQMRIVIERKVRSNEDITEKEFQTRSFKRAAQNRKGFIKRIKEQRRKCC